MAAKTDAAVKRIKVAVAADRLSATVQWTAPAGSEPPAAPEVVEALQAQRVVVDEAVQARVAEFVRQVSAGQNSPQPAEPFVVARGTAAQNGTDEKFTWDESFQKHANDWQGDAAVNYYSFNSIITVEAGTVIGSLQAPVPASQA